MNEVVKLLSLTDEELEERQLPEEIRMAVHFDEEQAYVNQMNMDQEPVVTVMKTLPPLQHLDQVGIQGLQEDIPDHTSQEAPKDIDLKKPLVTKE
ncbi:hypothetical protein L6164_002148 [Bauhinia variegata]|uniref:Uncharacterized protein n=1 Tax=Bauhinia variegata TaxID=167791 RepID=A0ACB9PXB5_BAUVA|nr:hypothetical protein L6164_002148 [Bauhinia variegata]